MPRKADPRRIVHFVGFRDDRYWNALRVFGPPDFIHRDWDLYATGDIAPDDVVVFAKGKYTQQPGSYSRPPERHHQKGVGKIKETYR